MNFPPTNLEMLAKPLDRFFFFFKEAWIWKACVSFMMVIADVFVARMKGDTPVNSTMSVGQARKLVEQLKIEASFCRIKVRRAERLEQKSLFYV